MNILGLSHYCSYNQAACLIQDGKLIAFAEEERFNRTKHSPQVCPEESIGFCLKAGGVSMDDIDEVSVGHSKIDAVYESFQDPDIAKQIGEEKLYFADRVRWFLNNETEILSFFQEKMFYDLHKIKFYPHHKCHAYSAIMPSKFANCNFITADGDGGENAGIAGYYIDGNFFESGSFHCLGSLGGFYSDITELLGFMWHSGEGKTMGLASYGKVDEQVLPAFFNEQPNGVFTTKNGFYKSKFLDHLSESDKKEFTRNIESPKAIALAATAQHYFEKVLIENITRLHQKTGLRNLAVAGGSFLNCSANGKISKLDFVDNLFIQPAAHDSGTALGAAILGHLRQTGKTPDIDFSTAYWGPAYTKDYVANAIIEKGLEFEIVNPSVCLSDLIAKNKTVGYFQGRSEVGPRALCHRSILANPMHKENNLRVNKIKKREFWRPFAPVMLEDDYFDIVDADQLSPFMLMASQVRKHWKSKIPAVVHIDGSCRPQSLNRQQNEIVYDALKLFKEKTGVPVFLNTSFNLNHEPLVETPQNAIDTFLGSELDCLLIENCLIHK